MALLGILWLAVRSARVVIAILATTLLGLIMTTGIGLLATGRFNVISVAFIPLFVGLGIDFSIQVSVRCLAERRIHPELKAALTAAGRGVGGALALAAAAIGVGFFAFLPTSYIGVAELGTIAGIGMIIAFTLSITLLPALLVLLRPAPGGHGGGRLCQAGAGRELPPSASPGRPGRGTSRGGPGSCTAAVGAFRLRPAAPQESRGGIDVHPSGPERPIPTGRPTRSPFWHRLWPSRRLLCAA